MAEKIEKIKEYILEIKIYILEFISCESEYEPIKKAKTTIFGSAFASVIFLIISAILFFTKNSLYKMCLLVVALALIILVLSLVSGIKTQLQMESGIIQSVKATVIKINTFPRKIEAVTDDEENMLFICNDNIKIKKNTKYLFYYTEDNDINVIEFAKQISKNKKKFER